LFVKYLVFLAVVIFTVNAVDVILSDDAVARYVDAFEKYQIKFNKHYATKEQYDIHLRAYAASMERIKEFYKKNPDSRIHLGETSRSDMVRKTHSRRSVETNPYANAADRDDYFPQPKLAEGHTENNIPTAFSWFNVSDVKHPAKDQGSCGSCYAFSAIGALEMQSVLEGNEYVRLSPEQALDCSGNSENGCCGGNEDVVYDDITQFVAEEDYPYLLKEWDETTEVCRPYECAAEGKKVAVTINGYDLFDIRTSADLKKLIWMYGPVCVGIEVPEEFFDYSGGVFDCSVFPPDPDGGHAVIAVGFGDGYIVLRNSYGEDWGLDGDFLLSDQSSEASCHLFSAASTSVRVSVVKPLTSSSFSYASYASSAVPASSHPKKPSVSGSGDESSHSTRRIIVALVIVIACLLVIGVAGFIFWYCTRNKGADKNAALEMASTPDDGGDKEAGGAILN